MIRLVFAALLLILTLLSQILHKTYAHIQPHEIKRRARSGDPRATSLYRSAAYGSSLQVLLWIVSAFSLAGAAVLLSGAVPAWLAFVIVALVAWAVFIWLPDATLSRTMVSLGTTFGRVVAPILHYTYPLLRPLGRWLHSSATPATGLYEKADLLDLLAEQAQRPDNRIAIRDLAAAEHALVMSDEPIREQMLVRTEVRMLEANEVISPVLVDELHHSGQESFPVYQEKRSHLIGTLQIQDLVREVRNNDTVFNVMKPGVSYINEAQSVPFALGTMLRTDQSMLVVVNRHSEIMGIVTLPKLLTQFADIPDADTALASEDLQTAAAWKPGVEPAPETVDETPDAPLPEPETPQAQEE